MHPAVDKLIAALDQGIAQVAAGYAVRNPRARRLIGEFLAAGALSPDTAQPFHPRTTLERWTFAELLRHAVIRESRPGRYYLDERTLRRLAGP